MADLPPEDHTDADEVTKAPRPPNSWILYRTAKSQELRAQADEASASAEGSLAPVRRRQADISRTISQMWKTEPEEVKQRYAALAEEKRLEHERKYPVSCVSSTCFDRNSTLFLPSSLIAELSLSAS